jgi:uncharacterized protein HemX
MRPFIRLALIFTVMSLGAGNWISLVEAHPQHREEQTKDPALEAMRKKAEKERNQQRQSELKRDTDHLYRLAEELKKSVDSSNEHVLSVEVIRKAEEIEKLAKSVRTKMKADGYGSTIPD